MSVISNQNQQKWTGKFSTDWNLNQKKSQKCLRLLESSNQRSSSRLYPSPSISVASTTTCLPSQGQKYGCTNRVEFSKNDSLPVQKSSDPLQGTNQRQWLNIFAFPAEWCCNNSLSPFRLKLSWWLIHHLEYTLTPKLTSGILSTRRNSPLLLYFFQQVLLTMNLKNKIREKEHCHLQVTLPVMYFYLYKYCYSFIVTGSTLWNFSPHFSVVCNQRSLIWK